MAMASSVVRVVAGARGHRPEVWGVARKHRRNRRVAVRFHGGLPADEAGLWLGLHRHPAASPSAGNPNRFPWAVDMEENRLCAVMAEEPLMTTWMDGQLEGSDIAFDRYPSMVDPQYLGF